MKNILTLVFLLPFFLISQVTESKESKLFRYWAQQERKKSLEDSTNKLVYYKNEISFYIKGEKLGEYQKATYYSIIKSISDVIKNETNDKIKKEYYDTLVIIQEKMQKLKIDEQLSNRVKINAELNSTKPNKEKIDSIFINEKNNNTEFFNEYYRIYFNNLYFIFSEKKDTNSIKRIYNEFITLYVKNIETKNDITYYGNIFENTFQNKDTILIIQNEFWKNHKDIKEVNDLMYSLVITNDMKNTKFHKELIDNLIVLNPTPTNYFRLLNYYEENNNIAKYNSILTDIKIKFPQYKDEIDYNFCVNEFNKGNYKTCYNMALKIGGNYKGKALKLAGICVGNLAMSSGTTTFERKCNYYYAIQLLKNSNNYGENNNNLITSYSTLTPDSTEKFDEGNPKTQFLSNFNVTVNVN